MPADADSFGIGPFEVRRNPSAQELAEKLNRLREAVDQCRLQPGPGYTVSRSRGGTTLQILPRPGGGGGTTAAEEACPFQLTSAATTAGLNVTVGPGTINGVIPGGILSALSVPTSAIRYICIDCDTDGKAVTSAGIAVKTSPPAPPAETAETAPTAFSFILAVVTNGTVYRTIPCNNITVPILPTLSVDKETYVAGLRNFTQYYNWGV